MKKFFTELCCLAIAVIACISCKIGLGEAVDTQAPELTITSPSVGAVIRDQFAISGAWSDDGSIKDPANGGLTIVLERTDNTGSPITYTGSLSKDAGTWSCIINPKTDGNTVLDGEYQATVTIQDTYEHKTVKSITFTVDNTPPVVVLQRPSSKNNTPEAEIDLYGQKLTLTGQAADDNNISSILVKFYSDPACTQFVHQVELKNVPPTIELDVAKFVEGQVNDYSKIYGGTAKGNKVQVYCQIEAFDNAQKYPTDGSNQTAEDTRGNCTTSYYLYEEIATSILSDYKITDVYHIFSGNYVNGDASRSAASNTIKELLKDKGVKIGSLCLDPRNNPTFKVSGKSSLAKDGKDFTDNVSEYTILNNSDIIIEVNAGLDNIPLDASSLQVVFIACDENGDEKTGTGAKKVYPTASNSTKSGSSYKFTTTVNKDDGLDLNSNYIINVEGSDEKGNSVEADSLGYGFQLRSSSTAPVIKKNDIKAKNANGEYTMDYSKKTEEGQFKATITFNSDLEPFTVFRSEVKDGGGYTTPEEIKPSIGDDGLGGWKFDDLVTLPVNKDVKTYRYEIYDIEGGASTTQVTAQSDGEVPVIFLDAVPDNIDTLNSSYTFSGTTEDSQSGVKEVTITVSDGTNSATATAKGTTAWSYKLVYGSTTEPEGSAKKWNDIFATEGTKTVTIKVKDNVGNEGTKFKLTKDKDKNNQPVASETFVYDKEKPVLTVDTDSIRAYMPKGGFNITGTAIDSYAFEELVVKEYRKTTANGTYSETANSIKGYKVTPDASNNDVWSCRVPLNANDSTVPADGFYKYEFIAIDSVGNEVSVTKDGIEVDTTSPGLTITAPASNTAKTGINAVNEQAFSFKGDITGESVISGVYYKIVASGASEPAAPSTGNVALPKTWTDAGWLETNSGATSWSAVHAFEDDDQSIGNTIWVYAVDGAGNMSKKSCKFDVDFKDPVVETTLDGVDVTTNTTKTKTAAYTFKFKASDTFGLDATTPITVKVSRDEKELTRENDKDYQIYDGASVASSLVAGKEYEIKLNGTDVANNGLITYEITAKDKVGKETKAERNIRFDTCGPEVTVLSPDLSGYLNQTSDTVKIQGSAEDSSGTDSVWYAYGVTSQPAVSPVANDESWKLSDASWKKATGTTSWSFEVTAQEGTAKNLYIVAIDKNGMSSASVIANTVKLDKSAPTMLPADYSSIATNTTFTLTGDVYDKNGIESVQIDWVCGTDKGSYSTENSGEITVTGTLANAKAEASKATWSKEFTITTDRTSGANSEELSDGKYTFTFTTKDVAGKETTRTQEVTIDTQKPSADFTASMNLDADSTTAKKWLVGEGNTYFTGTASDTGVSGLEGIYVAIDGATPTQLAASDSWSYEKALSDITEYVPVASGTNNTIHSISVYAKDKAGNQSETKTGYFRYDKENPTLSLNSSGDYVNATTTTVKLSGNASDGTSRPVTVTLTTEKWNSTNSEYENNSFTETLTDKNGVYSFDITKAKLTAEARYRFTVTAKDYADKKVSSTAIVTIDETAPDASIALSETAPYKPTVGGTVQNWYKSQQVKVKVTLATEDTSGIESVEGKAYDTSKTDPSPTSGLTTFTKKVDSTTSKVYYEGSIELPVQGSNTIYAYATDNAGNKKSLTKIVYCDSEAPDTTQCSLVSVDGENTLTKLINETPKDVTIIMDLKDKDNRTPIAKVSVNKTGAKTAAVTSAIASGTNAGKWQITVNKDDLPTSSGSLGFKIEDSVGNSTIYSPVTFEVDKQKPTISFLDIADADTGTTGTQVNGTITIPVKVTDNEKLQTGCATLKYSVGTSAPTDWSTVTTKCTIDETTWTATLDTTTLSNADGKNLYFQLSATDKAGNVATPVTTSVIIDQKTDIPLIKFSNLTTIGGKYFLKYGTNAQLEGTISDDDSATTVIDTFIVSTSAVTATTGWTKGGTGDTVTYTKGTEVTSYNKKTGEFTFTPANTADGAKTLYFYVKDNGGNIYYTANTSKISNSSVVKQVYCQNKTETSTKALSAAAVTYTSDGESPTIGDKLIQAYTNSTANGTAEAPGTNVIVGGTKKNKIQFIIKANDASGIASMSLVLKNASGTQLAELKTSVTTDGTFTPSTDGTTDASWTTKLIDISSYATGSISLAITATDNCGLYGNANEVFVVDNEGPKINISSPAQTDEVTAAVSITGQATDTNIGSETIKYLIPTAAQRTAQSSSGKTAEEYYKSVTTGWEGKLHGDTTVNAFEFLFNNDTATDNYSLNHYTKDDSSSTYGLTATEDVYTVPIYFMATDKLGNVSVKGYSVKYNPDADKPKTEITYPSTKDYDVDTTTGQSKGYVTLGGTIRLNGSVTIPSMTTTPDKVYIQIADSNGNFNTTDKTKAGTGTGNYGYTVKTISQIETEIAKGVLGLSSTAKSSWWGIEATRTSNSWSFLLNDRQELEKTNGNTIKVRACGLNAEGKMGSWSEPVTIKVDADAPTYTSKLYQFSGTPAVGSQTAEREYSAGVFLKGQWYIGAHITDPDKVVVENAKKDGALLTQNTDYWVFTATDEKSADVFIKLDAAATKLTSYTISARDAATGGYHYVTPNYEVNVDNTAPTIEPIKSGDGYPIAMTKQSASNYVTTFTSESVDNGSGVSRIAFYFKRGSKIELPIPTVNNASKNEWKIGTAYSAALTTTSDNMYGVNVTGTKGTGTGTTTFTATTATDITGKSFIRAGGLVQILGTYYKIASVSGAVVTVNSEISSNFTQVFFPAVMVIDNSSSENTSWSSGVNTQKGDDGDGMVESFKKSGSTWTWDASIYSSELDDGEVTLVCVAFDEAGNNAKLETNFMLANKTPRLSKVFLATDLNGNGNFEETEQGTSVITSSGAKTVERYYSALNSGTVQDVLTIFGNTSDTENSTTESGITMRDKLGVAFEFVSGYEGYGAGQGDMYYKMSVSNAAITAPETATSLTTKLSTTSSPFQAESCKDLSYLTAATTDFSTTTQTGKLKYTEDALNYINLTLWDSSNSKQGTLDGETTEVPYKTPSGDNATVDKYASFGAQWTVVNIPLKMDLVDGVAPTVTIEHPEAEASTGHVDLGSTLTGFTGSNEFDANDKVSGLVTFDVTVKDEKRINTLKLNTNFGGTASNYTIGSYSNGTFAITSATPVAGITFAIAEQTFDIATGHTIKFNVTIDTTKVSGGAKANVTFTLTANDGTNNGSAANQMDVVPYITSVSRASTTVNTYRSKLGKYQVVIGETLNVTGFNLPTGDTYYRVLSSAVTTKSVPSTNKITSSDRTATGAKLTAPGNSGYVVAVTNGVSSLNNMNNNTQDNNKQTGTMANASDTWTDDVYLSAWKNDEYFYFSNDPISPAMDGIVYSRKVGQTTYDLRRLYGGWATNGSKFYASYANTTGSGSSGNAPNPASKDSSTSLTCDTFGDPATFYDVITDANGNRYNCLIDCWQGNTDGWGQNFVVNRNGYYTHNGAGTGNAVASVTAKTANYTHVIERMGNKKAPDSPNSSDGYDEIFNQFLNPRLAQYNGVAYLSYYDRYAKCLKYAALKPIDSQTNIEFKYSTEGMRNGGGNNSAGTFQKDGYTSGDCVVAGYDTTVTGGSPTRLDVGIWSAVAVDTTSSAPVIAYYDATNKKLMIATGNGAGNTTMNNHKTTALATSYPLNSNSPVLTGSNTPSEGNAWKRQEVTGSSTYRLGQYVSMVVDGGNNLHIAAYGTAGGNKLYYIYGARSDYGTYTFTTTCVDAEGAGTWTDIQLDSNGNPVISYYDPSNDSSENAIKVAYLENGVWDTMTAPLNSSAVSNRVTLALDVTDGASLASATANNSKLAVGYVSSRFDCIYLRKE